MAVVPSSIIEKLQNVDYSKTYVFDLMYSKYDISKRELYLLCFDKIMDTVDKLRMNPEEREFLRVKLYDLRCVAFGLNIKKYSKKLSEGGAHIYSDQEVIIACYDCLIDFILKFEGMRMARKEFVAILKSEVYRYFPRINKVFFLINIRHLSSNGPFTQLYSVFANIVPFPLIDNLFRRLIKKSPTFEKLQFIPKFNYCFNILNNSCVPFLPVEGYLANYIQKEESVPELI